MHLYPKGGHGFGLRTEGKGSLINWPAFALTTLYVIVTSIIWEVTLAIPREWWGYEPSGMIGITIAAWSRGQAIFPVEAALVWLAVLGLMLNAGVSALSHAILRRRA